MKHSLHHEKLSSGVRVLFIDVPNSNTFSFSTVVRGGFKYTKRSSFELPHLLEHLAFDGTKSHPTQSDFAFALEGDGTYANAGTSNDTIRYYYNGGRTDLENVIGLGCSQLVDSTFPEDAIESEKGVVESELSRLLEDDRHMCWFASAQFMDPGFGMPYRDRIAQMAAMKRDEIVSYYRKIHTGNNTWVILAGDFKAGKDIAGLTSQLEDRLTSIPRGEEQPYKADELPTDYGQKILVTNSIKQTEGYFDIDFVDPTRIGPAETRDLRERAAMRIFNTILGGGTASRLFLQIRQKGLSYGPYSSYHFDADYSTAGVSDRTLPAKLLPLFRECMTQVFDIVKGNYTDAELKRARGYERGSFQMDYERPADLAGWYGNNFVWGRELISPEKFMAELEKVTRQDITRVASKFFNRDSWVLSVRAPEGSVDEVAYRQVLEDASA